MQIDRDSVYQVVYDKQTLDIIRSVIENTAMPSYDEVTLSTVATYKNMLNWHHKYAKYESKSPRGYINVIWAGIGEKPDCNQVCVGVEHLVLAKRKRKII
jgi:hypothetical protein